MPKRKSTLSSEHSTTESSLISHSRLHQQGVNIIWDYTQSTKLTVRYAI